MDLPNPLRGVVSPDHAHHSVALRQLSLGGGVAQSQCHIRPGSTVPLEFRSGMHSIRARVLIREARPQELTFELVQIDHQDRSRWRRHLVRLYSRQQGESASAEGRMDAGSGPPDA